MKIVLINPPHTAIGSRVPDDHLPPLDLLAIGGPLIDAGHEVRLVDAEFGPMVRLAPTTSYATPTSCIFTARPASSAGCSAWKTRTNGRFN